MHRRRHGNFHHRGKDLQFLNQWGFLFDNEIKI
jgi:hypothetical protein